MIKNLLDKTYRWAQKNSLWVIHFNTGGCNGCDIEILDLLTPRYDIERLGIIAEASPRHADVLLCTGPVTQQTSDWTLADLFTDRPPLNGWSQLASCSNTGGVFYGSDTVLGGVDKILPVDLYLPGCPCRPEAIIEGLLQLRERISKDG